MSGCNYNSFSQQHGLCHPFAVQKSNQLLVVRASEKRSRLFTERPNTRPHPNPVLSRPVRTRTLNCIFQPGHQFFTPVRNATCSMISSQALAVLLFSRNHKFGNAVSANRTALIEMLEIRAF